MTQVATDLRNTLETARRLRFEQINGNPATNVQDAITGAGAGVVGTPTTVTFAMSPYVPSATDIALYVDTAGGAIEIDLAPSGTRTTALTIKDVTGHAAAGNITIKPSGAETIDGYTNAAPLKINSNYGGFRLNPKTAGYVIAP